MRCESGEPVMDGLIFKDFDNSEYDILTSYLWKKHFRMHELDEIMREREIVNYLQKF